MDYAVDKQRQEKIIFLEKALEEANNKILQLGEEILHYKNNVNNFQQAINCLETNIYWKDRDGYYLGCNNKIIELSGVTSIADVIGKTDYELSPRDIADKLVLNDKLVMNEKRSISKEEQLRLPSGEIIYLLSKKSPLIDSKGEVIGIIGASIDITEVKLLQDKVNEQNEIIRIKDSLKTQFIENFSHDVKIPINALIGRTQLLKLLGIKENNQKMIRAADAAENSAMVLDALFVQMQNVMIHEEFGKEIYNTEFNLHSLIKKEIEIAEASLLSYKNVYINSIVSDDLSIQVNTDHYKLSQILRNILSNAIKYTDEGNINIKAEATESDDKVFFQFKVSDTGIGIDETYKKNIFEKFNRANITSSNNNRHGMGVGLYIVKNNLNILGGSINFESSIGQGSTFNVEIPLNKA